MDSSGLLTCKGGVLFADDKQCKGVQGMNGSAEYADWIQVQ
jgi:hypothetical protein